jgi:pyruvate dehydrogenase E1 component beta subunit
MVGKSLQVAEEMAANDGIDVEVIDLLTLKPVDMETIIRSVRKTHRCVVVHEAVINGGLGGEIAARVQEEAFYHLDAPILRIGAKDVPIAFSPTLEDYIRPKETDIISAITQTLNRK